MYEAGSEARVAELRSMIEAMLTESQIYSKIRSAIAERGGSSAEMRATLARLLAEVERSPVPETLGGKDGTGVGGSTEDALALRVELRGGSCFAGEAVDAASTGAALGVRCHLLFNGQRGSSGLAAAGVDPELQGAFLFEIARPRPRTTSDWHELLTRTMPQLRLCVTRERLGGVASSKREVVATGAVDWRQAFLSAGAEVAVRLEAAGPDSVLDQSAVVRLALDVAAVGDEAPIETPFDQETTKLEIKRSTARRAEAAREFYLRAKEWWRTFTDAVGDDRGVRVFARDEAGELRCVCSFVAPLRAGRGLDSPRHCARFVTLVEVDKSDAIGGGSGADTWLSPQALAARRAGDVWDHATLLCSLLLGFGLDAYVALGTYRTSDRRCQPHAWVVTFSSSDDGGARVVAWESVTGRRSNLVPLDADSAQRYESLACVFNDAALYANRQLSDKLVDGVSLDIEDPEKWMRLEAAAKDPPYVSPTADFALLATRIDVPAAEVALEADLKRLVQERRLQHLGLLTHWDNHLAYVLQPALAAYENERLTGNAFGNDDFQDAIKRLIPEDHCFKGFPTCFSHLQPHRMLAALERGEVSAPLLPTYPLAPPPRPASPAQLPSDVLHTSGDFVRHALRIRIFPYAGTPPIRRAAAADAAHRPQRTPAPAGS